MSDKKFEFDETYRNYFSLNTDLGNFKPPYSYGYPHRKYYVMTKYKFDKNFGQNFKI